MSAQKTSFAPTSKATERQGSFMLYLTGFLLSVVFTIWAYVSVVHRTFSGKGLMAWLLGLAVVQFFVQLFFFLHIGREARPRWKLLVLFLMFIFVLIVVLGSLWVMYNLNYRMTPQQINQYMSNQAGSGF